MVGMGTNIQNTAYLCRIMSICNKQQHIGNIWHSIHGKVKQHGGWVGKILLIK